jgi:hypothetical protein
VASILARVILVAHFSLALALMLSSMELFHGDEVALWLIIQV